MKWFCNVCVDQGHTCVFKLKSSGCSHNGIPPFEHDQKPVRCLYSDRKKAIWESKKDIANKMRDELINTN